MDEIFEEFVRERIEREEREAVPGQVECHGAPGHEFLIYGTIRTCPACGAAV